MEAKNNKTKKVGNKKKKKFKNTRLFKLLRILLLIIIIVIIVNIIFDVTHKSPDKVSLVIGANKIDLKHDILIDEDNNIYLSKDDVANLYDNNIYNNPTDNTVITTYNKHIAILEKDKNTMSINDTVTAIKGKLKEENEIMYLPFSDMGIVYDFEYSYNPENKALIVDSVSERKTESVVLRSGKIKEKAKIFSKAIQKVKKAEYVTVLENENNYTKVRTSEGNIGYIKTSKLSEPKVKRDAMVEEKLENVKLLEDYSTVGEYEVLSDNKKETLVVNPKLLNINEESKIENIINLSSDKFEAYRKWAEQSNVTIAAGVSLSGSMNKLCSEYGTRTDIINSLYRELVKNRITMICIDFDTIDDVEGFYRFVIEMVPRFKEAGIRVTVKYKDSLDKDRLNGIVDYVF